MRGRQKIALLGAILLLSACSGEEEDADEGPPRQDFQASSVELEAEPEALESLGEAMPPLVKVPNVAGFYSTQVITGEGLETEVQPGAWVEVRAFLNQDRDSYAAKQYSSYDSYTFNLAGAYEEKEAEGYSWALQGQEELASGEVAGTQVLVAINGEGDTVACSYFTEELQPEERGPRLEATWEPLQAFCDERLGR